MNIIQSLKKKAKGKPHVAIGSPGRTEHVFNSIADGACPDCGYSITDSVSDSGQVLLTCTACGWRALLGGNKVKVKQEP